MNFKIREQKINIICKTKYLNLFYYNFIKKESLAQMFSREFCEISKNTFFKELLWTTDSGHIRIDITYQCWYIRGINFVLNCCILFLFLFLLSLMLPWYCYLNHVLNRFHEMMKYNVMTKSILTGFWKYL